MTTGLSILTVPQSAICIHMHSHRLHSGSGGVSLIDGSGALVKSVELPDLSPFVAAVRP